MLKTNQPSSNQANRKQKEDLRQRGSSAYPPYSLYTISVNDNRSRKNKTGYSPSRVLSCRTSLQSASQVEVSRTCWSGLHQGSLTKISSHSQLTWSKLGKSENERKSRIAHKERATGQRTKSIITGPDNQGK